MPWNPEHYNVKPEEKKKEKSTHSEDWWERHKSYIEHRKTYPYGKPPEIKEEKDFYDKTQEEKELLDASMEESIKQKEERTPSEKMQDELEPIPMPCPMHEDYDE